MIRARLPFPPGVLRTAAAVTALALLATGASAQTRQAPRKVPVESLIYDLKNPDPVRRKEAAQLIGDNKLRQAVPDLVAVAQDPDPEVRRTIVNALDKLLDVRSLPAFIQLSSDPEKDIRERCIIGIVNLYLPQESGLRVTINKVATFFNPWSDEWADVVAEPGIAVDGGAISALTGRLQDPSDTIRLKAARALGILKGNPAVPGLLEALKRNETNSIRFEIMRALRKIGDPSVGPELMPYLGFKDDKVRNEAIYTLGRLHYRAAAPEMIRLFEEESALPAKLIDKPYREALLDALAMLADPAALPLFQKEKQNPDDILRLHAFEGLARLAESSMATEVSRDRLHEKSERVKTAQAFALYRMGRTEFLDEVVNRLGNRKTNTEARMYLLELGPQELPGLYAQANNNDTNVREALCEIYGLIGDERAVPVLQNLAKDKRGQISAFAAQAMRRISARASAR